MFPISSILRLALTFLALTTAPLFAANFTSTWTNLGTGIWGSAANWNTPGSGAVFPNNGALTYDAVLANAGVINLDRNIVIQKLTLSDGEITGGFNLTLNESLLWSGGAMYDPGTTAVAGTASILSGSLSLGRTLRNTGTMTSSGSSLFFGGIATPGVLTNTGTFNVTAGGDFRRGTINAGHAINNSGTWNVSGAGLSSFVDGIAFNNTGTVNVTSGSLALYGGGTSTGNFAVSAGAELFFRPLSAVHLLDNGATFTGAGLIRVGGFVDAGNAAADVITAASLTINDGGVGGLGALNVGNLRWTSGEMTGSGTTRTTGPASTISGGFKRLLRTLINSGTTTYAVPEDSNDVLEFGSDSETPGVINNTGTVNVSGGGNFGLAFNPFPGHPGNAINNSGIWNAVHGAATGSVNGVTFNNTGTVNVTSGTLALNRGGTSTGSFVVSNGATLRFGGGTHTLNAGSNVSGAGTVELGTGDFFNDGTWNFNAGTYNLSGVTSVKGGTANFNAAASTGTLSLSNGILGGTGTLNVTGNLNWTAGSMEGTGTTNVAGSASTISNANSSNTRLARTLINSGTMTFSGNGWIPFGSGATAPGVLNNTGTFNVTGGGRFEAGFEDAANAINNSGIWNVSGAGTTSEVDVTFNNTGTVNVTSGALELRGGGTSTGSFAIAAAAALVFDGGTHLLDQGTTFAGAGLASIDGGTVIVGDAAADIVSAASFAMNGGTVAGPGKFNLGKLLWTNGTMEGTGTTTVTSATSTISSGGFKALDRTLNNSGTIAYSSGGISSIVFGLNTDITPGVINNTGTFGVTAGGDFAKSIANSGHAINNSGNWNVSGAGLVSSVDGIAFNNTGTVNVASGTLSLGGGGMSTGAFATSAGATLNFTGGTHFLNAGVSFTGTGLVNVAGATVTAGGTASVIINIATLGLSAGTLDGAGVVNIGNLVWTGGTMDDTGRTNVSGIASTIGGTSLKGLNRTLNNSGTITYGSGDGRTIFFGFNGSEPGVLNNTGIFNVTAGGDFTQSIGNPEHAINNSGAWNVSGATFTSHVTGIPFNNTGTVSVTGGTFALGGGGTSTGSFGSSAGATLSFSGGTHLLKNGASFTGAGIAKIAGGTLVAGDGSTDIITAANFTVSGGTVDGLGTFQAANFNWTAGTMRGTGTTAVTGAAATIGGSGQKGLDRKLNNSGTIAYSATDSASPLYFGLNPGETGVLNNSGTFNVNAGGDFSRNYASAGHAINNSGTWNVSGAGTVSSVTGIAFKSTGTVNVQSGTLALHGGDGGGTTGAFNVSAPAVLQIAGNFTFTAGSHLAGAGSVVFNAGTSQLNSAGHTVAAINVTGGSLNIGVSQTLPALQIGAGGIVTLGNAAPAPPPEFFAENTAPLPDAAPAFDLASAVVPEPGILSLLVPGALCVSRRKRRAEIGRFNC